jgi:hypothetical protein
VPGAEKANHSFNIFLIRIGESLQRLLTHGSDIKTSKHVVDADTERVADRL